MKKDENIQDYEWGYKRMVGRGSVDIPGSHRENMLAELRLLGKRKKLHGIRRMEKSERGGEGKMKEFSKEASDITLFIEAGLYNIMEMYKFRFTTPPHDIARRILNYIEGFEQLTEEKEEER